MGVGEGFWSHYDSSGLASFVFIYLFFYPYPRIFFFTSSREKGREREREISAWERSSYWLSPPHAQPGILHAQLWIRPTTLWLQDHAPTNWAIPAKADLISLGQYGVMTDPPQPGHRKCSLQNTTHYVSNQLSQVRPAWSLGWNNQTSEKTHLGQMKWCLFARFFLTLMWRKQNLEIQPASLYLHGAWLSYSTDSNSRKQKSWSLEIQFSYTLIFLLLTFVLLLSKQHSYVAKQNSKWNKFPNTDHTDFFPVNGTVKSMSHQIHTLETLPVNSDHSRK